MAEIHEIIDRLLKERGISGSRMSTDLGMSRSFMTELRKGRAKGITVETANKIADYLNVSTGVLLGKEEPSDKIIKVVGGSVPTGVTLNPQHKVRRAKLYYLRNRARKKNFLTREEDGKNYVWIHKSDGTVEKRPVTDEQVDAVLTILKQMSDIPKK